MSKKKILFVYYTMMLGGSTTSLLSLLENFDYDKYEVDLLLYRNEGPFLEYIPKNVNLLPQACVINDRKRQIPKTLLNGSLLKAYLQSFKYQKKFKPLKQSMAYTQLSFCRKIDKEYDVAIGFLELWADVFLNERIKAKKKISWVHVDYEKAHMYPGIDRKMFAKSDVIVHVSDECLKNFVKSFPELEDRCVFIENILTKNFLLTRSSKNKVTHPSINHENFNLLSVCRLAIDHKGLDRGIKAIRRLLDEGFKLSWYIVGDGPDKEELLKMISNNSLEKNIFLLGQMECPYPIFSDFDAFFLPSRFEGKPMAVTESMMLGLPPIVAEYASANEQISHDVDGYIAKNSEDGIYESLKYICNNLSLIEKYKSYLSTHDYDNTEEINKINSLLV